ncbi:hypothetical protein predicted by Glimmer/Critica [Sorangium cellulosum So ce56]|uniref:AgmX/PglI C-terminal domain-containing protein n=1 Tax=Sorangium cellulosum (strain So ce56) TaxID=448385 RepID=A9FWY8_SORC5|nr:hypothetical protein [Sorangium cellulosum]CAN95462.1 hypothetical protein predicted by Glimmer/Critica [Sorangium cellulosum So ce56]
MGRQLSTPTAILLGSAMIAAAVYLGLRHGPAGVPADPRPAGGAPSPPADAASAAAAPSAGPGVPRDEVATQAARALEAHRPALIERCYKPAVAAQPAPREVKYVFNLTFDAQGRQLARGIIEDREASRPEVTACLVDALPPVAVAPPGANVRVDVPFSLP